MKVAIIGSGFTGLAAAITLIDKGHQVEIFESSDQLGGLANGLRNKNWKWNLEKFYHHIFANDKEIISMAKKVGLPASFKKPKTSTYRQGIVCELDSPQALLKHPQLSWGCKIWMATGLAILKLSPNFLYKVWEQHKVVVLLPLLVGNEGYQKVWLPLLTAKFGKTVKKVNMAWFWTRVAKRTKALGYFDGGFEELAKTMGTYVAKNGGRIHLNAQIKSIKELNIGVSVDSKEFDQVLITTPAPIAKKLTEGNISWPKIDYLWAQTLILELNKSLMDVYWLNILENDWPFLVAVEHTNFVHKSHYNKKTLIYLGNYLEEGDNRLEMTEKQLLNMFLPYIEKINPKFRKSWVDKMWKFQSPYSQPVFPTGFSKKIPPIKTKMKGVFVANMSMVYPFDRGTNYAVEIGVRAAKTMMQANLSLV